MSEINLKRHLFLHLWHMLDVSNADTRIKSQLFLSKDPKLTVQVYKSKGSDRYSYWPIPKSLGLRLSISGEESCMGASLIST